MEWNASCYLKFEKQRNQPIRDLLSHIHECKPESIADLGCGPGNSTVLLKQTFPNAEITGIDSSENMVQRASEQYPELQFMLQDIRSLTGSYDMIFSNACLQWIPDHRHVIPDLFSHLSPGGIFAAQFPMNDQEPLFQIIKTVAANRKWNFSSSVSEYNGTLLPMDYFNLFAGCSSRFQIWETKYYHNLPDHRALIDWVKGSRLRPYLAKLDEQQKVEFEQEIESRAVEAYPFLRTGEVVLCFNRFFVVAVK